VTESIGADLLERIADDLAGRGIDVTTLAVVSAETTVWPDASLGCPQPGMSYPQRLVEGTRIVVEAAGRRYDYRMSAGGTLRLCTRASTKVDPAVIDVP
jgi:hypothetical protein